MKNGAKLDPWLLGLFVLHLFRALWFADLYPHAIHDPDLMAYFVYFRNWIAGSDALHGASYFTVPKPLLVFFLGPLADVSTVSTITAIVAAFIGAITYLIGRDSFDRTIGIALSFGLLLDADMAGFALRSSADLYLAFFLMATIWLSIRRHLLASSLFLLAAGLIKPVALPCALHFLALDDVRWPRRLVAALLPLAAVPLLLLSNQSLLGDALGSTHFFASFEGLSEGTAIGPNEVVRFVFWTQLAKRTFISTAPFGIIGIVLWLSEDRRRLTHPFFLVPMLFLGGYVGLSTIAPFVPFYRFFWPVQIWYTAFLLFGIWESARRIVNSPRVRLAIIAAVLWFAVDDAVSRQIKYSRHIATPFDNAMAFVTKVSETWAVERRPNDTILTPLAFLPYFMWQLETGATLDRVFVAERLETEIAPGKPEWIVWVPDIFTRPDARPKVIELIQNGGYQIRAGDDSAALLRLPAP